MGKKTMIKLIDILEDINEANGNFILPYKMGGINVTGDKAWNKWKILLDRNRRDDYVYKVLNTIKEQNYITTYKQYQILINWYNKGSAR
jgi:sRNA-binding regulator protein Hfq